ncbi:MAG: hypothetical protein HC802_04455 [Caldilineaceae bacterium]|nr:hypothetical protein [Caldilineaceae bacterium]
MLILADVDPVVVAVLKRSGALQAIGEEYVLTSTPRLMEAEESSWMIAQQWLVQKTESRPIPATADESSTNGSS